MPIQVTNTTDLLDANLSACSSLKSPTFRTKPRLALDGNKSILRLVICGFLGFLDNLKTLIL